MEERDFLVTPYDKSTLPFFAYIFVAILGYVAAFGILWLFYRMVVLAAFGAVIVIPIAISASVASSKKKRLARLLGQFQNLLESLVVSLQSGGTDLSAFKNAKADMELMYTENADIVKETGAIIAKFENGTSIGEALTDLARRTELEDIKLFATIYSSVEGKGDKTSEIVIRTQKVLSDKIAIQAEIQTLSAGAIMEINIMIFIPVLVVAVMGFMGGDMMEGLFTVPGRIASTFAICIFAGAYVLGKKMTSIDI